jgi:hypothetical protein
MGCINHENIDVWMVCYCLTNLLTDKFHIRCIPNIRPFFQVHWRVLAKIWTGHAVSLLRKARCAMDSLGAQHHGTTHGTSWLGIACLMGNCMEYPPVP